MWFFIFLAAVVFFCLGGLFVSYFSKRKVKSLESAITTYEETCGVLEETCDKLRAQNAKVLSQKKSSEVKTGRIAECLAPFLKDFPYDQRKTYYFGQVVDLICIDDSGVHFVEVKSGNARLTKSQKQIKEHIENGRVSFITYRIKGE